MKHRILYSTLGAVLLLAATAALALAWPDQPPEKVLISGPGIEGQVEVKDAQSLSIFRLGTLEDFNERSSVTSQIGTGYKIVRFFDGGEFNFAQLTYYPNPSSERGSVYFEDGPMLQGNHTPYNQTWLYTKPDAEQKLRALLKQLGAKLDNAAPAQVPASGSANANVSSSGSTLPLDAAQQGQATGAQTAKTSDPNAFSSAVGALIVAVVGLLVAGGALWLWRARRTQAVR
jgi:hypothetical protein